MPKRFPRHADATRLEHEFDAIWAEIDLLRKREERLRQQTPGVPGGVASTSTADAEPWSKRMAVMGS